MDGTRGPWPLARDIGEPVGAGSVQEIVCDRPFQQGGVVREVVDAAGGVARIDRVYEVKARGSADPLEVTGIN